MSSAFRLTQFHNVGNVAILTLRERGYRVWWEASERPGADDWWAEQEGREFVATNPLALLGLGGIVGEPRQRLAGEAGRAGSAKPA